MKNDDDRLSQTFAALASPIRRAILARLAEGEATVNELAEPFDKSLPNISKHIKILEDAGLITRGRKAQYRPCIINTAPIEDIADWTEQYRQLWESRFDQMDDYIQQMKDKGETNNNE